MEAPGWDVECTDVVNRIGSWAKDTAKR